MTDITANFLVAPVSGLMGLGFEAIAESRSTPFWEALANSDGTLDGIDVDLHPTAAKLVERSKAFLTEVQHLSVILQMTLALRTLKV